MNISAPTRTQSPDQTQPPAEQAKPFAAPAKPDQADKGAHPGAPPSPTTSPAPGAPAPPGAPPPVSVLDRFRRPRLVPGLRILHRAGGEIQIGIDPRHAVVLGNMTEPLIGLLHTLDGRDTSAELARRAGPDRGVFNQLLGDLVTLGLVEDAVPPEVSVDGKPPANVPARLANDCSWWALRTSQNRVDAATRRQRAAMVIHGGGRVAVSLATLLASAGIGRVHVVASGAVKPEEIGTGYREEDIGQDRSVAVRRAIQRASPTTTTSPLPRRRKPDLVILTDTAVPDPQLAKELFATGTVSLLAWAGEGVGVVGPLIVPSRSCCLRCVDLHKTEADPRWPAMATQLAAHGEAADVASAQASASFAATQALRVLDGPRIAGLPWQGITELPVWSTAIEIDTFSGETRRRTWTSHPACGCDRRGGR